MLNVLLFLLFEIIPIFVFAEAMKLYKKEDNLIMIFYIIISGIFEIFLDFVFLDDFLVGGIVFQIYLMFAEGRTESEPRRFIKKNPYLILSSLLIINIIGLVIYKLLT